LLIRSHDFDKAEPSNFIRANIVVLIKSANNQDTQIYSNFIFTTGRGLQKIIVLKQGTGGVRNPIVFT